MDKESNNPENFKRYTRELRDQLDDNKVLSVKEITNLQKKYDLNEDELGKLETISYKKLDDAKTYFDYGDWDKALSSVEEAMYKNPFNREILTLHYQIQLEKDSLLGETDSGKQLLEILLKRVHQVDRSLYKKFIQSQKERNKKSPNKLWLISLTLLIIPIILLLPKKEAVVNVAPTYINSKEYNTIGNREIPTRYKIKRSTAELTLNVRKSVLEGNKNNFYYTLNFLLQSEKENIIYVNGVINWLNRDEDILYSETFSTPDNFEYYLNEVLPVSYVKTSLRQSPQLDSIFIEITDIKTKIGKERKSINSVETLLSGAPHHRLQVDEALFYITKGVTANYLSITFIITNNYKKDIKSLNGDLEWLDEYNLTKNTTPITLLSNLDIPIEPEEKRVIHKILELSSEIEQNYRLNITEGI